MDVALAGGGRATLARALVVTRRDARPSGAMAGALEDRHIDAQFRDQSVRHHTVDPRDLNQAVPVSFVGSDLDLDALVERPEVLRVCFQASELRREQHSVMSLNPSAQREYQELLLDAEAAVRELRHLRR